MSSLLDLPSVYSLAQRVLLPGQERMFGRAAAGVFEASKGLVLDVGCGPRPFASVSQGALAGVDVNPRYVKRYAGTRAAGGRLTVWGLVGRAERLPFPDGSFDECRCGGLLHHLSPSSAGSALNEMRRCVRPGGRLIVFDSVLPHSAVARPLAWLTRKLDRGAWTRTEEELVRLVRSNGEIEWSASRFTYTHTGLEGMLFVAVVTRVPHDTRSFDATDPVLRPPRRGE